MLCAAVMMQATEAFARAGGGHSYSGKSHSHDSGGSVGHSYGGSHYSGGGDISGILSWLFRHPGALITILIICGVCYFVFIRSRKTSTGNLSSTNVDYSPPIDREVPRVVRSMPVAPMTAALRRDPNFSYPLFLDFASSLAQRSLTALNTSAMAKLEPYISAKAFVRFPAGTVMKNVVVGSVKIIRIASSDAMDSIETAISFCATIDTNGHKESFWFESEWHFSRQGGVVSKGPEEMLKLACPSCGATSDKDASGACAYCGKRPAPGSEAWAAPMVSIRSRETRPPVDLGSYTEEQGTYLATVYSPALNAGLADIMHRNQGFTKAEAEKTFRGIFIQLQKAWSNRDMQAIRPLVTDHLYRVYSYWIEAYRSAGVRNIISDIVITSVEIVAAEADPFYDSITARMSASMVDRCLDENGTVAGGSATPRVFTEYWTFVRVSGGGKDAGSSQTCSGCGATIEVGMTGECPYCGMVVSGKNFDWVLSRIDQDEDYGT